jgi:thiol-disulfide isomerase/thioredoxin
MYCNTCFYDAAPWCTHCQKLEPVWESLAGHMETSESKIEVAKIDCVNAKGWLGFQPQLIIAEVCEAVGVKGYPTLVYIHEDVRIPYKAHMKHVVILIK